jgi:hypothetical protein
MKRLKAGIMAIGLGVSALTLLPAPSAQAASSCTGTSGYWSCVSTTGAKVWKTTVIRSWVLKNSTTSTQSNAKCNVTTSASYSSATSFSVTASVKAQLFGVAEATVSGTQSFTDTLTTTEANSLEQSFTLKPGQSVTCRLFAGYYSVPTKHEQWNNYKVVSTKTGTTTVPFNWGLEIID